MPEAVVRRQTSYFWFMVALLVAVPIGAAAAYAAQGPGPGGGQGAAPARDAAPVDLTGYWVSIVTEDWIERMSPDSPPSGTGGGFGGGGGAPAPAAAGTEPCRAYGAAGSLRVPGRLHITWADENTLQVEMDAGSQTRLFHFNPSGAPPAENTLQGYSVAAWETGGGRGGRGGRGAAAPARWGSLRAVTTNLGGGYLLSSRSSYSDATVLTEHFAYHSAFGDDYFTVTAIVEDGGSANITSSTFKKEPDGSKFSPTGCEIVR